MAAPMPLLAPVTSATAVSGRGLDRPVIRGSLGVAGRARGHRRRDVVVTHFDCRRWSLAKGRGGEGPREPVDPIPCSCDPPFDDAGAPGEARADGGDQD